MAKKKVHSTPGTSRRWTNLAVAALVLLVGAGSYLAVRSLQPTATPAPSKPPAGAKNSLSKKVILPTYPRRPRPATLPPEQFSDPVIRQSYEVAQNNPQLLEHMPCYCGCYISHRHTSNLDCFADNHGET